LARNGKLHTVGLLDKIDDVINKLAVFVAESMKYFHSGVCPHAAQQP